MMVADEGGISVDRPRGFIQSQGSIVVECYSSCQRKLSDAGPRYPSDGAMDTAFPHVATAHAVVGEPPDRGVVSHTRPASFPPHRFQVVDLLNRRPQSLCDDIGKRMPENALSDPVPRLRGCIQLHRSGCGRVWRCRH